MEKNRSYCNNLFVETLLSREDRHFEACPILHSQRAVSVAGQK